MAENGTKPEETPELEDMSWGDSKKYDILAVKLQKATLAADEAEQEKYYAEMEALIGKCIISLPRSWLVRRAPDGLDFTKPGSLEYVKSKRVVEIIQIVKGIPDAKADDDAKN